MFYYRFLSFGAQFSIEIIFMIFQYLHQFSNKSVKLRDEELWNTCTHIVKAKDRSKYSVSIASADADPCSFTIEFSKVSVEGAADDAGTATDVPPVTFQVENEENGKTLTQWISEREKPLLLLTFIGMFKGGRESNIISIVFFQFNYFGMRDENLVYG